MRLGAVVILLAMSVPAVARTESLGEAAAREKARRQKKPPAAKVLTEDDLQEAAAKRAAEGRDMPAPSPSPASSPGPIDAYQAGGGSVRLPSSDDGEAGKRARASELKASLASAEGALKAAEDEVRRAEAEYDYQNGRQASTVGIDGYRRALERAREQLKAARDARDDVLTTIRRESIPPGWVR